MSSSPQSPDPVRFSRSEQLRDGTPVLIRAVRPDDRQRLIDFFHGLEPESIYTRVFTAKKDLTEDDLRQLLLSDYGQHVLLLATLGSGADEIMIGGGAYTVVPQRPGEPRRAEVSFTIEEDYHGQGLSSLLMQLLIQIGREHGLQRFGAEVLAGNDAMLKVFLHCGLELRQRTEDGVVFIEMDL